MFTFCNDAPDFWVQMKGNAAGTPLRQPSANCLGIKVDPQFLLADYLFYVLIYLQSAGKFRALLKGSVIPFIRKQDVARVIATHLIATHSVICVPVAAESPQGSGERYA